MGKREVGLTPLGAYAKRKKEKRQAHSAIHSNERGEKVMGYQTIKQTNGKATYQTLASIEILKVGPIHCRMSYKSTVRGSKS